MAVYILSTLLALLLVICYRLIQTIFRQNRKLRKLHIMHHQQHVFIGFLRAKIKRLESEKAEEVQCGPQN